MDSDKVIKESQQEIRFDEEFRILIDLCKEILKARYPKEKDSFFAKNHELQSLLTFENQYNSAKKVAAFFPLFYSWAKEKELTKSGVFENDEWISKDSIVYFLTKENIQKKQLDPVKAKELRDSININLSKFYQHGNFFSITLDTTTGTVDGSRQSKYTELLKIQVLRIMYHICPESDKNIYISELNGLYADIGEKSPFERKSEDAATFINNMMENVGNEIPELKPLTNMIDFKTIGKTAMELLKSEEVKQVIGNAVSSLKNGEAQNIAVSLVKQATNPDEKSEIDTQKATTAVVDMIKPVLKKFQLYPADGSTNSGKEESLADLESQLE